MSWQLLTRPDLEWELGMGKVWLLRWSPYKGAESDWTESLNNEYVTMDTRLYIYVGRSGIIIIYKNTDQGIFLYWLFPVETKIVTDLPEIIYKVKEIRDCENKICIFLIQKYCFFSLSFTRSLILFARFEHSFFSLSLFFILVCSQ